MISEWKWALACTVFLAALIVLLYCRARAQAKHQHEHIDRKIDVVHQAVGDVRIAVEGSRKDAASAAEGIRTAQHASDQAAALRGDKSREALKGFQVTIWRQWAEALKSKFGRNHDPDPPPPDGNDK